MVAGKDAQPTRVDRQPFVQAVLHREVRDLELLVVREGFLEPGGRREVLAEVFVDAFQFGHEAVVVCGFLEGLAGQHPKHGHRILVSLLPGHRVEAEKQAHCFPVPGEPEIFRDDFERAEKLGKTGDHVKLANFHCQPPVDRQPRCCGKGAASPAKANAAGGLTRKRPLGFRAA